MNKTLTAPNVCLSRIAGELHDVVSHAISVTVLRSSHGNLGRSTDTQPTCRALDQPLTSPNVCNN